VQARAHGLTDGTLISARLSAMILDAIEQDDNVIDFA
jgi:hypothetical protein